MNWSGFWVLIAAWFGIQLSVADQAIDQWRVIIIIIIIMKAKIIVTLYINKKAVL